MKNLNTILILIEVILSKTTLQYFVGQTKGYNKTETFCDLCIYLLSDIHKFNTSAASCGELNPKRLKLCNDYDYNTTDHLLKTN